MAANLGGLVASLDGLPAVFACLIEVPRFGVGGGERADDVRLFPFGLLAGLLGNPDGALAIADRIVRTRGEQPGEIVENRVVVRLQFHGLLEIGDRRRVITHGDGSIPPSPSREELLRVNLQGPTEAADRLARLLGGKIEKPQLPDHDRITWPSAHGARRLRAPR